MLLNIYLLCGFIIGIFGEDNISQKMYYDIDSSRFAACVRRFNGTHQIGCSSEVDGNVGVLHLVSSQDDVDWLLKNGTRGPYVVSVTMPMFTRDVLISFNASSKVNGVIITYRPTVDRPESFSQEDSCPNRYTTFDPTVDPSTKKYACDSKKPWNTYGTNILNENWVFPVVIVSDEYVIQNLTQCFTQYNMPLSVQDDFWHSLCGVEMGIGMSATINTEVCIRRTRTYYENHSIKQCDPVGGRNIVHTVNKISAKDPIQNNSLIIVAARLDSKSMFDGLVPGALSTVTSLVTLLATAHIMARNKPTSSTTKPKSNVMFLLLDGEAYDYIGSTRLIYDMKQGLFPKPTIPIREDHIKLFFELSQIGTSKFLGLHHSGTSENPIADLEDFAENFKINAAKYGFTAKKYIDTEPPFAPSSLFNFQHSFENFTGAQITTSEESLNTNKYYHSMFDDDQNIAYKYTSAPNISADSIQSTIRILSLSLAGALLTDMYGENSSIPKNLSMDEHLVDELLYCYLISQNCTLLTLLTGYVDQTKPTFYVGVKDNKRLIVTATGFLLANLTGEVLNMTRDECKQEINRISKFVTSDNENYYWIITNVTQENAGYCNRNYVNFTSAVSPAFDIDGYDWSSGQYPSWSESVWNKFTMRTFLQPSPHYEKLVFLTGITILALSFVTVISLQKHIERLVNTLVSNPSVTANVIGT